MVRERAGIQISVAKKARSWDICREKAFGIDWHQENFESPSSADAAKTFGRRSTAFVLQTRFAHHISIPQLSVLVNPMTRTPTNIEVDKMMTEINTGANSLHRRSIRRVTALRWVRVYDSAASPSFAVLGSQDSVGRVVVARVGTHSRSMAIMFPIPLRFSHMPRPITRAKIHGAVIPPFRSLLILSLLVWPSGADFSLFIKPGRRSAVMVPVEENRMGPGTRKIHPMHAKSTEARFADMVMRRVRNRDGDLSIHLPTNEDRHSAAKVVHNPLDAQIVSTLPPLSEALRLVFCYRGVGPWATEDWEVGRGGGTGVPHRLGKQGMWEGRSRK